jgi:hypothetical protein
MDAGGCVVATAIGIKTPSIQILAGPSSLRSMSDAASVEARLLPRSRHVEPAHRCLDRSDQILAGAHRSGLAKRSCGRPNRDDLVKTIVAVHAFNPRRCTPVQAGWQSPRRHIAAANTHCTVRFAPDRPAFSLITILAVMSVGPIETWRTTLGSPAAP